MSHPTQEDEEAVQILVNRKSDLLTDWEIGFLEDIETKTRWSDKEAAKVDQIFDRVMK